MKVVFLGTPDFAIPTLDKLVEKDYNVELVITQKDRRRGRGKKLQYTPIKKRALELGLEVYQPDNINSKESVEKIKELEPDFIIVIAFGQILKKEILNLPKYSCINVHASLLPRYRGAAPINWAIINGEKETGISIMEMDTGLDTGDVYRMKAIPIDKSDNYLTIHDKLAQLGAEELVKALEDISSGKAIKTPQDDKLSTYAPMIYKETGKINWNKSANEIDNLVRGVTPWPSAYTEYKGETVKIHKVNVVSRFKNGANGEIVKVDDEGIYVNAKDSCVVIEELQFPNKKRVLVREYLLGNTIDLNYILK